MVIYFVYTIMFFFFNDTATTEIYTLSLHDALPISAQRRCVVVDTDVETMQVPFVPVVGGGDEGEQFGEGGEFAPGRARRDRKSTRLNSSHANISYAVFCLKKKKTQTCDSSDTTTIT